MYIFLFFYNIYIYIYVYIYICVYIYIYIYIYKTLSRILPRSMGILYMETSAKSGQNVGRFDYYYDDGYYDYYY